MNEEKKSVFSGRKARIAGIALCVALILSVGTLTALAASNESFPFFQSGERAGGLAVRSDDNGTSYSTDGGETWSDTVPGGVIYTEEITEDGESFSVTIFVDDDDSDGGFFEDYLASRPALPFASFSQGDFEYRLSPEGFEYIHMLRVEDDTIYHSLDGGETWVEGLPEGMVREGADEYTFSFESEDGNAGFSYSYSVSIDD